MDNIHNALESLPPHLAAFYTEAQGKIESVLWADLPRDAQNFFNEVQGKFHSVPWAELPHDAQDFFQKTAADTRNSVAAIDWEQLPTQTKDWITAHPEQTAFYVASGIVFVAPFVLTGPLLGAAGFTAAGPAAGELAD